MLMHINHDTELTVGTVQLPVLSLNRILFGSGTCYSGIRFGATGTIFSRQTENDIWSSEGAWYMGGNIATYFLVTTITDALTTDGGRGQTQISLGNLDYDLQLSAIGETTSTLNVIIQTTGGGTIYATQDYLIKATVETDL